MKGILKVIKNNCFMLKYILKYTPGLVIYSVSLNIYQAFVRVFTDVYVAMFVLNAFQDKRPLKEVVLFLVFVVLCNVLGSVLEAYYTENFSMKQTVILYKKMHLELFEKARKIELACYDNPEFYNDFVWAMAQSDGKALQVMNNSGMFIKAVVSFVSTVGIISTINSFGIYVALFTGIMYSIFHIICNKYEFKLSEEQIPLQRKRDYTSRVLYLADFAKEVRLSNIKEKLTKDFSETNKSLVKLIRYYGRKIFSIRLLVEFLNEIIIMNGIYVAYLVYLVLVKKTISYGGFLGMYNGSWELTSSVFSLSEMVARFQKDSLYIERFKAFLNYEPKLGNGSERVDSSKDFTIKFNNVTFKYDGADEPTLKNINLTLKPGEKIALVGYNGAGKTTLVKLLMRLYDVTEGSIELNGRDIRDYSISDYYNCFGVVFQDFKLFSATIAENVMMDRIHPEDKEIVLKSLEKSDFTDKLNFMENGINTMLTREFSKQGENLSGGEAQKVAIARVFSKDSPIMVLDEPSSSLDPVTEYYINQTMMDAAQDKSIVYISHRLSTTKMADKIYMLEKGRIIEEGTHDKLLELNGKYAQMFHMQAKKYGG